MIKSMLLAAATVAAFAVGTVATPDTASADRCFRGGGFGYDYGYRANFGPRFAGPRFAGPGFYGPRYVPPRRVVGYRGYGGLGPYGFYGPRRGGVNIVLGF
ncbi:MAG: hypothetical protein AAGF31_10615 [Planctomycetota bacterium]